MSLDVHLSGSEPGPEGSGIFIREAGKVREITRAEWDEKFPDREPIIVAASDDLYHDNITHNLGKMADEAGVYDCCWRPDEHGMEIAAQLIDPLRAGLDKLKADPDHFKRFNPDNGWGDYDGLVEFVEHYLAACEKYPSAKVYASR